MSTGWRYLPISMLLVIADQWSKALVESRLAMYESVRVMPMLDITRAHNSGAAFSFLADAGGWQRWFFTVLALAVSAALVVWLRKLVLPAQRLLALGLTSILAGAIGNVIDRIRFGHVVDFVHVHWGAAYFPAFNVADAAISVGAGIILLDAWLEWRRERR